MDRRLKLKLFIFKRIFIKNKTSIAPGFEDGVASELNQNIFIKQAKDFI